MRGKPGNGAVLFGAEGSGCSQAVVLTWLGRACQRAGDHQTAVGYLDHALRSGSARGEAHALTALGDLAHGTRQQDEAQTRYTQAQRVLARTASPGQARISERLSRLDQPGHP